MNVLKTVLISLVGFGLLFVALVADVAGQERFESIPSWDMEGTGPDREVRNEWGRTRNVVDDTYATIIIEREAARARKAGFVALNGNGWANGRRVAATCQGPCPGFKALR